MTWREGEAYETTIAQELVLPLSLTLMRMRIRIRIQPEIAFGQWADGRKDVVFRDAKAQKL